MSEDKKPKQLPELPLERKERSYSDLNKSLPDLSNKESFNESWNKKWDVQDTSTPTEKKNGSNNNSNNKD